jgi:hypothetical protein
LPGASRTGFVIVKKSAAKLLLLLGLTAVLVTVSGCQTDDPENVSVRPWNSPTSPLNSLPMDMGQHP